MQATLVIINFAILNQCVRKSYVSFHKITYIFATLWFSNSNKVLDDASRDADMGRNAIICHWSCNLVPCTAFSFEDFRLKFNFKDWFRIQTRSWKFKKALVPLWTLTGLNILPEETGNGQMSPLGRSWWSVWLAKLRGEIVQCIC